MPNDARPGRRHEHEFEPAYGLPEPLPSGEHILWQGAPDWRALAVRVFHVRAVALYFAAILALRAGLVLNAGDTGAEALASLAVMAPIFGFALACLAWLAWMTAKTTAYTLTDKRVVMRIGIVLSVTYNLPYARIEGAEQSRHARCADIAIATLPGDRIAYAHLWPHARPWRLLRTQPMLRCLRDAPAVAALFTHAWSRATGVATFPAAVRTTAPRTVAAPQALAAHKA